MNSNYIIEENNENISNNVDKENVKNINEDNKNNKFDYFSYFLNKSKNQSFQNKSYLSLKINDINNATSKNNRNNNINNSNKINKSCKTNFEQKYKKEMKIRQDINQYLNSREKNNNIDKKVNNYYDIYKSSVQPKSNKPEKKIKSNIEQKEPYINKFFTKKEITRKKSAYFRSLLSKNESIGRNKTSDNTYSSSKIILDSAKTNRSNSGKIFLSGMKLTEDNQLIINNKPISNYGQYLFEKGKIEKKQKQEEINEIQRLDDLEQYKLCSFMPKTNIKRNRNVHSKYMDNNKLILNEEKYDFKPKINNNYKTDLNFEQRQTVFKNLYKQKNEEMKKYFKNNKYDEKGNELFKPKLISRQIHTEKNIDIFNKNYSYYKKYNMNKNQLIKKFYNHDYYLKDKNKCSKKQTNKIMNDLYSKVFKLLFNELDSDHDDLITSLTINLKYIPKFILTILEPILKELKEDEQSLNCEEFILVMKRLFEDTPMLEKQKLINYYQNKNIINNYNNNTTKRIRTPYHSNLNSYYKYYSSINNTNESKAYSSKSIALTKQKEKETENNEKSFDDSERNHKENHINNINDLNSGFDAISQYTFNNYLKQVKS